MNIPKRPVLVALSALTISIIGVYCFLSFVIRSHRTEVEQQLHKLLGAEVSFAAIEAGLWDGFGFNVKEFRISDDPRFAATPFVKAEELRLGVSLWHLLVGRFVVNSLTFTRPELQIITNEDGLLNLTELTSRKEHLLLFPGQRIPGSEKKNAGLSLLITRLKLVDGRIDFIDRSISAPAELQIKKIDLDVGGLDVSARARLKLAASLDAAVGQDLRVEGEIGPPALGKNWAQQPMNLDMEFDSLYLPMIARAIPFFRDRIPREFDITGPMYFHTRMIGTLQQPRFTKITLKVPFLGSSEYNAVIEGKAELTQDRDWSDAPISGQLTLTAISLSQLRKLPHMRQILADDFATSGTIDVRSRFEGTWNNLRFGALLDADDSELQYPGRFEKRQGTPAQLKVQLTAHNTGYEIHPSELRLGKAKILVSGGLRASRGSRLSLALRTGKSPVTAADFLLVPSPFEAVRGNVEWDLLLERDLESIAGGWETRGVLSLEQVTLRHKVSGEPIDHLTGSVSFAGRRARAHNISFRLGSTPVSIALEVPDINSMRARYSLRADNVALTDLPLFPDPTGVMRDVLSSGELILSPGAQRLQGVLSSSTGTLHGVSYRDLQTDISWSPKGIRFTDLRTEAFNGELRGDGSWHVTGGQTWQLSIAPTIDALSLRELLTRLAPQIKERFDGELALRGEFGASAVADGALWETLTGSGVAVIRNGTIKDFNLMARLFYRMDSQEQTTTTQRIPQSFAAVLEREHTPVQEAKATFSVEAQRVRAQDFSLLTSEYAISGSGWVALDGTTAAKGVVVFSPTATRDLQREYGAIRYFRDRKGRLVLSFRVDGKLPNVRIRPENRALAQALRWGADDLSGRKGRGESTWLPDSLDRLLHR
ncbi:MAG TPA: AsmA-like C-terminal region-containing protein [Candidatus Binatia bacterium]|nr:AsmA-like C-terminal region-containing protein [Candidatus Binatia bacterium]